MAWWTERRRDKRHQPPAEEATRCAGEGLAPSFCRKRATVWPLLHCVLSVGLHKEGERTYFWESPRIRRTEVRPTSSRRAISALATPARC